jgi:hypothetical protein
VKEYSYKTAFLNRMHLLFNGSQISSNNPQLLLLSVRFVFAVLEFEKVVRVEPKLMVFFFVGTYLISILVLLLVVSILFLRIYSFLSYFDSLLLFIKGFYD